MQWQNSGVDMGLNFAGTEYKVMHFNGTYKCSVYLSKDLTCDQVKSLLIKEGYSQTILVSRVPNGKG